MLGLSPTESGFSSAEAQTCGRIVGSADLLAQLADRLYLEKKNPLKAQALLDGYAQELVRLGYDDDEVEEMKGSVRSPSA